jgi:hypothetical protein
VHFCNDELTALAAILSFLSLALHYVRIRVTGFCRSAWCWMCRLVGRR